MSVSTMQVTDTLGAVHIQFKQQLNQRGAPTVISLLTVKLPQDLAICEIVRMLVVAERFCTRALVAP